MTIEFNTLFRQRDVRITPTSTATATAVGLTTPLYVTLATHADLTNERVLTAGAGIDFTDNGAGGTLVVTGEDSTAANKGIVIVAGGEGMDVSYAGGTATVAGENASVTNKGINELATTAETQTGTDTGRVVTPDGLHDMTSLAGAGWFLDEDNMASDDATKVASQQSIKKYVDDNMLSNKTSYKSFGNWTTNYPDVDNVTIGIGGMRDDAGGAIAQLNISLPHGAVITSAIVYGDVGTEDETWVLHRINVDGSGSDGLATAACNTADNTIDNATVDNQNYTYAFRVSALSVTDDLHGAVIGYTTDYD